jgi:hypothetical protein
MPRYVLRPEGDTLAQWNATPASYSYSALDDAVEQPTVPTTTDYISTSLTGKSCLLNVPTVDLASNEEVVAVKAWMYGKNAANSTRLDISGSQQWATGNQTSTTNAWFSVTYTGTMTQAQVDALRIFIYSQGAVLHTVYAAYLEVFTRVVTTSTDFYFGCDPGGAPYYEINRQRDEIEFDNYRIGINIDTLTNSYESTATFMDYFETLGIKPLVGMLFYNRIPTEAECNSLDGWLDTYADKIKGIEFGNETGMAYQSTSYTQGALYADRVKTAYTAIAGRVPFLIQAYDVDTPWLNAIIARVPNIEDYCDGWTVHRYQTDYSSYLDTVLSKISKPLWITEFGLASDDGNSLASNYSSWPVNMSYATAATNLQTVYDTIRAKPGIGGLVMYRGADGAAHGASTDKEDYFGTVTSTITAKGAYTTKVKELIETERILATVRTKTNRNYRTATGFTNNAVRVRRASDWKLLGTKDTTAPVTPIPVGWTRLFRGDVQADFNVLLNEYDPTTDAQCTDETGYIKFNINTGATPTGGTGRGRLELQSTGAKGLVPGDEGIYTWDFRIPSAVVLPTNSPSDYTTINQFHGNKQAGYTGGMRIHKGDDALQMQVEGGVRLDANNYEYEADLDLGTLTRDTWTTIHYHVKWDTTAVADSPTGFAVAYIDNVKVDELYDIPTMGPEADHVMWRLGWYPESIPSPGLELDVRNVELWIP